MRYLVIGAGMMGTAAAYDLAGATGVDSVTLADAQEKLAKASAAKVNKLRGTAKVKAVRLDASDTRAAAKLMAKHAAALSAVPYFFNVGLAGAAIEARCHFADLGGNNAVVAKTYALGDKAKKRGIALAPDCGLSPGMASVLAGELMRRITAGDPPLKKGLSTLLSRSKPAVDALKIYVGGLPLDPKPPFHYQLVFSVEGLINEYVEPAKILRKGKVTQIEPLTEVEPFEMGGFDPMVAFHTSGGTSTLPETFAGQAAECFEKTLRYPSTFAAVRSLYDLGFFSSEKRRVGKAEVSPREITSRLFMEKLSSDAPDVCIMRVEAYRGPRIMSFSLVDRYDPKTSMTAMMRTTAWPAAVVLQMIANGEITKRGGVHQETDVPAVPFLRAMAARGVRIEFTDSHPD